MAASISYIPEPYERPYYEALFQAADVQKTGNIGGGPAVQFFARSKLPIDVLKNIWTVADQPSTNSLDLKKFAVAIRLIQLTQNGKKGDGPNLQAPAGVVLRPAMFEGVSGVSVQLPPAPGQQQPPQQQQQQQQPSQRQLSAPPTPGGQPRQPMQQQPQQSMRSVQQQSMRSIPPPTPGGSSRALVGQDPYTMTPQERSRYESLFPQYAKPDGFMYGKEAVALFMKSGVDQAMLREIWNMVDRPIDNRLDKLEFALAMHLIVCVSKKGLPLPKPGLPNSLQALKAAQTPAGQQRPSIVQKQGGAPPLSPARSTQAPPAQPPVQAIPSPTPQGQPQYVQQQAPAPSLSMSRSMSPQPQTTLSPNVPPVVGTSGLSISDAFEGLSTTSGDVHQPALPSYVPEQRTRAIPEEPVAVAPKLAPAPAAPTPAPQPQVAVASTSAAAASYSMGDSNDELVKLQGVLQKLQAENISLKAQLGNMTEEEKDVQKEIGATVAEISKLSNELSTLRGEVLAAKSRLLEASSQLNLAREKKSALTGQIAEATSTKEAINEAYNAVENSAASAHQAEHHAAEQQKVRAVQQSDMFEANLFGGGNDYGAPAPAPAPAPMPSMSQPPAIQQTRSHDSVDSNRISVSGGSMASGSYATQSLPPPHQMPMQPAPPAGMPIVQTVSSDDEVERAAPQGEGGEELFNNEFAAPAPEPTEPQQEQAQAPSNDLPPPQQFQQPPPEEQFQQPPAQSLAGVASPKRPGNLAAHHRQASGGFASDFVMGGAAIPYEDPGAGVPAVSPAARTYSDSSAYGYDDDEAYKNVEELKKKAQTAQETARDAEAAHRKLVNESDELRQDADKAEAMARSLRAAADEKKKGTFGGGKKKKLMKDAERAAGDAAAIKKRFLAVQGQAIDAQAVALETKREADKLRDEAEKAELEMASQASVKEQQRKEAATQEHAAASAPPTPNTNGYGGQQYLAPQQGYGYAAAPPPANGYGQYPPQQQQQQYAYPPQQQQQQQYAYPQQTAQYGGAMAPPTAGGFAPGVMGGASSDDKGGFDLPSPNAIGMAQPSGGSNPFE